MLLKEIVLNEHAKPNLDFAYLEREYKTLPAKLKEVLPANIKEWQNFQKQIDNLWSLYEKIKKGIKINVDADPKQIVLGDMPFKHSLAEVVSALKGPLKNTLIAYLFHGGFDITQYDRILQILRDQRASIHRDSYKVEMDNDLQQLITAATQEASQTGNVTIKNTRSRGIDRVLADLAPHLIAIAPKTITLAPQTLTFWADINTGTIKTLNKISSLTAIKGAISAAKNTALSNLKVAVDTVYYHIDSYDLEATRMTLRDEAIPQKFNTAFIVVSSGTPPMPELLQFAKKIIARGAQVVVEIAKINGKENKDLEAAIKQAGPIKVEWVR